MKVAIIGSRTLQIASFASFLPKETNEIISGGARGIDRCARAYALKHHIPYVEFLPEYDRYGKQAPLLRNREIVHRADVILAFWDGQSRGTKSTLQYAKKQGKAVQIFMQTQKPLLYK